MTTRKSFGRKLQLLRKARHLSAEELGRLLGGRSGKTISAWEVGKGGPKPEDFPLLCEILDVPIDAFYDEDLSGTRAIESDDEYRLVLIYRDLNDEGRARLYEYADDLLCSGKYDRKRGSGTEVQAS